MISTQEVNQVLFTGQKILVVEDEEINYFFLETVLTGKDAKVVWAKNGKEAVDIINKNERIDLILMDLKMPVMNGHEATKIIKKIKPKIPIIAQTAYALSGDEKLAKQKGCDGYISKPINTSDLLKIIWNFLYKSKSVKEIA